MYSYKIHEFLEVECEASWKELEKNSCFNFFQSFNYIREIIKIQKRNLPRIIVIFYNKKVIAILPLEIKNIFFFKVFQWIGTGKSDY